MDENPFHTPHETILDAFKADVLSGAIRILMYAIFLIRSFLW
jgi:hypothetical protein